MKSGGALRGLFIAIGVIDFVLGLFLFIALLSGYDSKYFIYEYYGLFAVIGIGLINAVLSMVIPAIKGEGKAVPGLVFSVIAAAIGLMSLTTGEINLDKYKENKEQQQQEEQRQQKKEEEEAQVWLSTAGLDTLDESGLAELAERYEVLRENYENRYSVYNVEGDMLVDGTPIFTDAGAEYKIQKDLAVSRCNSNAHSNTVGGTPVIVDHTYQQYSESGNIEYKHSYFGYGNFGYMHLAETVNSKSASVTTTSQTFYFINDDGFICKIGFVETVVLNSSPRDYFKCQLVYDVTYPRLNSYNYSSTDFYGVI